MDDARSLDTTGAADPRLERWERVSEWPLILAAALFLAAYAWPILDTRMASDWRTVCRIALVAAWAGFIVDYGARVALARQRGRYVWRHVPDLAILALPALRPLRLLRVVMLLKVLNRGATATLRGRIVVYVVGATAILLFCSSLSVLDSERGRQGATIKSFGDAMWWSITTITTVGYGDKYPVTGTGRWVAAGLMVGGIALLGVVTASIASWLIEKVREGEQEAQAATQADVLALAHQIAELRSEIEALRQETASRRIDRL